MARGPLARFLTATLIVVLIVAGLVLSFQFELGRPLIIFAGGICVLDAFARSLERNRRIVVSTDLATWALAGLLSMIIGIAWDHIGYVVREIAAAVICGLLFLAYKNVSITVKQRIDEPNHRYRN
jgi:hypothetical protein